MWADEFTPSGSSAPLQAASVKCINGENSVYSSFKKENVRYCDNNKKEKSKKLYIYNFNLYFFKIR